MGDYKKFYHYSFNTSDLHTCPKETLSEKKTLACATIVLPFLPSTT